MVGNQSKAWRNRSEAAKRGWVTRRERQEMRNRIQQWEHDFFVHYVTENRYSPPGLSVGVEQSGSSSGS